MSDHTLYVPFPIYVTLERYKQTKKITRYLIIVFLDFTYMTQRLSYFSIIKS